MSHAEELQSLVTAFANDPSPESEKKPHKPLTNREKVDALRAEIERLRQEGFPYEYVAKKLEKHSVNIAVSTLKTYLRECRKAQTTTVETIICNSDSSVTTQSQKQGSRRIELHTEKLARSQRAALPPIPSGFKLGPPTSPKDI